MTLAILARLYNTERPSASHPGLSGLFGHERCLGRRAWFRVVCCLQVALTTRDLAVPRRPHLASHVEIGSMAIRSCEAGTAAFLGGLNSAKRDIAERLRHVWGGCACGRRLRVLRKRLVAASSVVRAVVALGLVCHGVEYRRVPDGEVAQDRLFRTRTFQICMRK